MRKRWRTGKGDKSLRKKKERKSRQIAGKEQRGDDVTKTKLMKLWDWVGWPERNWKMPTCLKISGLCKLVLRFKWCLCSVDSIQILLKLAWILIGHFISEFQKLSLWMRLSAKPFSSCENEFYLHANKNHFHTNGFVLRYALKQRLDATGKRPITRVRSRLNLEGSWIICMESSPICTGTLIFGKWTLLLS